MVTCSDRRALSTLALALVVLSFLSLGVAAAQDTTVNGFNVSYGGRTYDAAAHQTTFTYVVSGTGVPPDLSHFDVEIPTCPTPLNVVAFSPGSGVSFGTDPTTGVNGIKWDIPLLVTDTRTYSITFEGNIVEGSVLVAVKGDNGFETASVGGPSCTVPLIDVEKFVSLDGVTWQDADAAPGPQVELDAQASFRFVVTNTGDVELTNLHLTDSTLDLSSCTVPATLAPDAFFECAVGPFPVIEGQHTNTATATGDFSGATVSDSDSANFFAGDLPAIDIEKFVSTDGGATWDDADAAPGPDVERDDEVSFKFVVTNTGTVALSSLTLSDSVYDTSHCAIPATLEPGASFECIIGPFPVDEGLHTNIGTATGVGSNTTVSDTDSASLFAGDDDDVIIVIEGPVEEININIITIFGIEIELDPDDPALTVIQIGDVVRVEGDLEHKGDTIIIAAINIIFIDVDVFIVDGQVWRDPGNCDNPPPPWAPARGWWQRCEGGSGMGMGMGGSGSRS